MYQTNSNTERVEWKHLTNTDGYVISNNGKVKRIMKGETL